jgi:hypothetical protein
MGAAADSMAAAEASAPPSALSPLPLPLVFHNFSLLPADARARAACVCRAWRAVVDEPRLWTRLDLSPCSGVAVHVSEGVLEGAVAKARGQLAALDVCGCDDVSFDALLGVVQAHGGTLRELGAGVSYDNGDDGPQTLDAASIDLLLQAAPQLACLHAEVRASRVTADDAFRMLRNEPPFQRLRLRGLHVDCQGNAGEAFALTLAAELAAHASLQHVELSYAPLHTCAALDALVDMALARQLVSLVLIGCSLSAASAPALARLLGSGKLTELQISYQEHQQERLLDVPAAALLGAALRANKTLTSLSLPNVGLWHDENAAAVLLSALTGHPSLRTLDVSDNSAPAVAAVAGALLGALGATNAPALTALDLTYGRLDDAALRPLVAALPHNTHLRTLDAAANVMSDACARDVLLPALYANASLRRLHAERDDDDELMHEAELLVARRTAGAA